MLYGLSVDCAGDFASAAGVLLAGGMLPNILASAAAAASAALTSSRCICDGWVGVVLSAGAVDAGFVVLVAVVAGSVIVGAGAGAALLTVSVGVWTAADGVD